MQVVDTISSLAIADETQLVPVPTDRGNKTVLRPKKAGVEKKRGSGRRSHGSATTTKSADHAAPPTPAFDLFGHSLGDIPAVQAAAIRAIQQARPYHRS